jgi:hypothetical protein
MTCNPKNQLISRNAEPFNIFVNSSKSKKTTPLNNGVISGHSSHSNKIDGSQSFKLPSNDHFPVTLGPPSSFMGNGVPG